MYLNGMLLSLDLRTLLDSTQYLGTLVVRLETDNRPECGVFSGRGAGFGFDNEAETNQRMPHIAAPLQDELTNYAEVGIFDFVIDRPARQAKKNQINVFHYIATAWHDDVYYECAKTTVLRLTESYDGFTLSFNGLDVVLPDYEPGWLQRNR